MMRILISVCLIAIFGQSLFGQKYWDGGALTDQWQDSANWFPDGLPVATDVVILNNQFIQGNYSVTLPAGNIISQLFSLSIHPTNATITFIVPTGNTAAPGLQINSTDTGLIIRDGGILKNASGATSGNSILINGKMTIYDGGRYIHQTARPNASISDKLVFPPGTNKGVFEFDVPGTAGYTISITGKTFGNLHFKSFSAGGNKSYSGSGSTNLTIRGDLWIDNGANLTSTMTADILISGNLIVDGKFNLNPSTAGTVLRRVILDGNNVILGGKGSIIMNSNFRNFEIGKKGSIVLSRNMFLSNASNIFANYGKLSMDSFYISGPGKFMNMDSAYLSLGDINGINFTNASGNVRTEYKLFSKIAHYHYNGYFQQVSGDALPDTILHLTLSNPSGLSLTKRTFISESLYLLNGILNTTEEKDLIFNSDFLKSPLNYWNRFDGGWEQSYINGPFTAIISANSSKELPSGNISSYAPILITNHSESNENYMVVNKFDIIHSDRISNNLLALHPNGAWSIQTSALTYKVSIPLSGYELNATPPGTSMTMGIFHDLLQTWTIGNSIKMNNPDALVLDSVMQGNQNISLGYFSPEILLPLNIEDFQGKMNLNTLQLSWNASGIESDCKFIVQESSDGQLFKDIGYLDYSQKDPFKSLYLWKGISSIKSAFGYYRLRIDHGFYSKYSPVIKIRLLEQVVSIFPNPASESFFIKFQSPCNEYLLEIVNIYGLIVQKEKLSGKERLVNIKNLKPGLYYLRIKAENFSNTLHLIKY